MSEGEKNQISHAQVVEECFKVRVLDRLDELEGMNREISGSADRKKLIAHIKKEIKNILKRQ